MTDKRTIGILYPARFFEEGGVIGVLFDGSFNDGLEMATHGDTWDEARAKAQEIVNGFIKVCARHGDPIPPPPAELPQGEGWSGCSPTLEPRSR